MVFSIGGFFGSSKQKSTTDQTRTTTPNAPSWYEPQLQGFGQNLFDLSQTDPSQYVAPANGLLTQAGKNSSAQFFDPGAYQSANGLFQGLMNTAAPQAKAGTILGKVDQYLNPYLENVETNALAAFDKGAGEQMAQAKLQRAQSDSFGGSGGDVFMSNLGSGLALNRGTLSGNIRHQGYDTAAGWANQQANRDTQVSMSNADRALQMLGLQAQSGRDMVDTASRYYADQQGIANNQAQIGGLLQGIDQARASAPIDVATQLAAAYGSLTPGVGLLTGETSTLKGTTKGKSTSWGIEGGAKWG